MYASPWFLTMFASVLSLNVAFRVMDLVLVEGKEILFKVGLALLESSQDSLVKMDMEEMIKVRGGGGDDKGDRRGGKGDDQGEGR